MINKLTEREKQILKLIANGLTNKGIAHHLLITESTVENHIHHIYEKLDIKNRAQATAFAFQAGIMSSEKAERE
jgi:DNA-binding NarL/FixJ family response regulator